MEDNRIGIIYCPRGGVRHSHKLWEKVQQCLDTHQLLYDFVQSESADSVERLAAMLAINGYSRIVVVGGDSALNRALRGILSVDGNHPALGVIPNGFANDFARFWGLEENDPRRSVEAIARGRLRRVDVGFLTDSTGVSRPFLNCVNIGLASRIISVRNVARRFGVLRFLVSSCLLLFQRVSNRMMAKINTSNIDERVMNFCIGSAPAYGLTPNAVPYSGLLDISVVTAPPLGQLFVGLWLLFKGRFQGFKSTHAMRTRRAVEITDTGGAPLSLDGILWTDAQAPLKATLKPEFISFIIP